MNLRTADRLRFAVKLIHILLTLALTTAIIWLVLYLIHFDDRLEKAEDANARQTRAIYLIGSVVDEMLRRPPGSTTPRQPPFPLPFPELQSFETNYRKESRMTKPSTDTQTERDVAKFRNSSTATLPKRMTLRFLALLTKKELAALARRYDDLKFQSSLLPDRKKAGRLHTRNVVRYDRIQSERRQRGHIK